MKLENRRILRYCRKLTARSKSCRKRSEASEPSSSRTRLASNANISYPQGKRFRVHTGDLVKAGQQLVDGPLVPHDILQVSGEEAVQQYLLHEIQSVYRSQRVEINDKHLEIIVARMLRKVKIETSGDTSLLPGLVCDKFDFQSVNEELSKSLRITDPGDSDFEKGIVVRKEVLEETNSKIEALGGKPAKGKKKPTPATASTQLLGITKAAVCKVRVSFLRLVSRKQRRC